MECIKHFSHEHPLSFFQLDDDENPKPHKCHICGLPILSSPSYTCSIDPNCNFFLHKACTQLPRDFYHSGHREFLYLELRVRRLYLELRAGRYYETYDSLPHNFTYKCTDYSDCGFQLHPLVAYPVEIKSQHRSHKKHPLVACCRESLASLCDGCGEEEKGFFFNCQECNFWIHQDCAVLPAVLKLTISPHPYFLTYNSPFHILNKQIRCQICRKPWHLCYNGVYFCGATYEMVHVACAKSKMDNLQTETILEFIQLPDEEDTFPSLVIRKSAENNSDVNEIFHKHPLILEDGSTITSSSSSRSAPCGDLVCDVCTQPLDISSPFYRCQSDGCHFVAHNICANKLHPRVEFFKLNTRYTGVLSDSTTLFFNSVFLCTVCFRPSNGFIYQIFNGEELTGFSHVECACAPRNINHASHGKHPMFQIPPMRNSYTLRCCSAESLMFDIYRCVVCDFNIHIRCALLPKRTRHKFDEHPLELIMTHHHNEDKKQELICEVCEQDIELKYWYYGCHKCEQYFHINCIPSVGYLSKIKFGKTFSDDRVHPQHPLTLTRMLTHERNERCGICNQIIRGFSDDEMAFHCSPCHFWVHFSCASATAGEALGENYSRYFKLYREAVQEALVEKPSE